MKQKSKQTSVSELEIISKKVKVVINTAIFYGYKHNFWIHTFE